MYKFSAPMPYTKENITNLLNINNYVEKSKISTLSFSLPSSCNLFSGFEQYRNYLLKNSDWNYWKDLISYSLDFGIDFIYLLNNPNCIFIENPNFEKQLEKLDKLLNELQNIGVNKLRISEHRLIDYISKNYPYFNIYASTSFEFKNIAEYKNFMFMHPNVKQIVPSHDCIKNFTLLKNIKKLFPKVEIELMINEGCSNGCPTRIMHAAEKTDRTIISKKNKILSNLYWTSNFCGKFEDRFPFYAIVKSNVIYPWEIEEYSKIRINNFKFVGRGLYQFQPEECLSMYLYYLKGLDNFKYIENVPMRKFIFHLLFNSKLKKLTVKDVKNLLPDIKHFRKYGKLCSSACGVECRYCYKCADKIQQVFEKKMKEEQKREVSACKSAT